jgi:hypothetical protein
MAGAFLTFLGSWVCSIVADHRFTGSVSQMEDAAATPSHVATLNEGPWGHRVDYQLGRKGDTIDVVVYESIGRRFEMTLALRVTDEGEPVSVHTLSHTRAGWPAPAVWGAQWATGKNFAEGGTRGLMGLPGLTGGVPFRPLWPGFAIDVVFWALVAWLPIGGALQMRRWLRARRGACRACGYPLGTSPVCTECGALVSSR